MTKVFGTVGSSWYTDPHFILKIIYGIFPIVIGVDKIFFNVIVEWSSYFAPQLGFLTTIPYFLVLVGIVEIIIGIIILTKWTRLGSIITVVWLLLITINLVMIGAYDIALRDLWLIPGAYALYLLS